MGGSVILKALLDIFRQSLSQGVVDTTMKEGLITSIWKGGDRTQPANYRPVALTSHLSKIMERIIRQAVVNFLESNNKIDNAQHGARIGRSTLSQLLIQYDLVLHLMESGDNVDVVYLDFSKAFNKVDHSLLLAKVKALGITGNLGRWIGNFLLQRRQAVKVGSKISSWSQVLSGVPQGSVLGPILFLIFISDLGMDLGSTVLKYVDDTKLIRGISDEQDVESLQADLEALYTWQSINNMDWNDSKFQALRMGPRTQLKEDTLLFSSNMKEVIDEVEEAMDLGIVMDSSGSFRAQRIKSAKKTSQKAGWVLRTFRTRDVGLLRILWRTLVQPHQDYASQLWAPVGLVGDIMAQEAPLRAFTRRMSGLRDLPYRLRLKAARLLSTERRQERYRALYTWKAIQGLVPNFGVIVAPSNLRRGRLLDIPPISGSRTGIQSLKDRSLQVEGPRIFNSLPRSLRDLKCSLLVFKKHLDSYLGTIPDQPRVLGGELPEAQDLMGRPSNSLKDWARKLMTDTWMFPRRQEAEEMEGEEK
jgi:ribonuclease P/MRP protein subunit RPP40